jgi:hypothetical protein
MPLASTAVSVSEYVRGDDAFVEVAEDNTLKIAVFAVLVSILKLLFTPDSESVLLPNPSLAVNNWKSRAAPAVAVNEVFPEFVGETDVALTKRTFEF